MNQPTNTGKRQPTALPLIILGAAILVFWLSTTGLGRAGFAPGPTPVPTAVVPTFIFATTSPNSTATQIPLGIKKSWPTGQPLHTTVPGDSMATNVPSPFDTPGPPITATWEYPPMETNTPSPFDTPTDPPPKLRDTPDPARPTAPPLDITPIRPWWP